MDAIDREIRRMVVDSMLEDSKNLHQQLDSSCSWADVPDVLLEPNVPLDIDFDHQTPDCHLNLAKFESDVCGTESEPSDCGDHGSRKRRSSVSGCGSDQKRNKFDGPGVLDEDDCLLFRDFSWPDLPLVEVDRPCSENQASPSQLSDLGSFFEKFERPCSEGQASASQISELGSLFENPSETAASVDSEDSSGCVVGLEPVEGSWQSAEYHFEQIQRHAKLAIAAMKRGQFERNKNIVTWAHDLKNKVANEVKKAAENAWEANKGQDRCCSQKPAAKRNTLGSTKRVEQFRKNMRRWMIGTQIGVEWMVYARMEHLQAISKFILGPALPADPASPSAVAESVSNHLQQQLPAEFVDSQLAEPEPGKRYVIGPGLIPLLHAKLPRKIPTLSFTMPADGDEFARDAWVSELKALFPKKPAPKVKGAAAKS